MNIGDADTFWFEAGAMSGPPSHRHQVEFPNDLAEFFDDDAREAEVLRMRLPGGPTLWRPLTYRGTDYGQWTDIWRLGLPTPRMGGPEYVGRIIRLDRIEDEEGNIYEVRVVDAGSAEAASWEAEANSKGQTGITGGPAGRRYGYW